MSDTTPDTTALRARCEVAAGRTVALNVAHRILLDPSIVRALCDGYDEAQRLRESYGAASYRTSELTVERDAARQALADLVADLREVTDYIPDDKHARDFVTGYVTATADVLAVIDRHTTEEDR